MTFGFGPGADMMKSYQANQKLINKRKSLKENSSVYSSKNSTILTDKTMSKDEFEAFKHKLILNKRKNDIRTAIIILSLLAVISVIFIIVIL